MRNNQEQIDFYKFNSYQDRFGHNFNPQDLQWSFQKN